MKEKWMRMIEKGNEKYEDEVVRETQREEKENWWKNKYRKRMSDKENKMKKGCVNRS